MPEDRSGFATILTYWKGAFQHSRREHKLPLYMRAPLAAMIAAFLKWWFSGFGTRKDVLLVFLYAVAAYAAIWLCEFLFKAVLIAPAKMARETESETAALKTGIATLQQEKAAQEADKLRLEMVFQKTERTWFKHPGTRDWGCRIGVTNASESKTAEGITVKVQRITPLKFPGVETPFYLRVEWRYGHGSGTVDKLGPGQEVLFDFFEWHEDSYIGWNTTGLPGTMASLNNPADFPDRECEVILQASADNCRPTHEILKVRWTGKEMEVERVRPVRVPAEDF